MPADPDQTVTIVTSRAIRAGSEEDFERWVEELNRIACAAPGYRAAIRLGQTAGFQHLLFRFHDQATAEGKPASPPRPPPRPTPRGGGRRRRFRVAQ
jgi:antibiotic biosynthesis monooxygenase (ABM) superfamily enzyme